MSNINMPMQRPCETLFVGNTNVCPIYHYLWEIRNRNVHDLDRDNGSMQNINMPMKRPYATLYLLAIPMFALDVTVCEILRVKMCMTSTPIVGMGQGQISICQSKGHMRHSVMAIAMFVLSYNHMWTQCTKFKSLTLKMKVKDVNNFDENWQAKVPGQHAKMAPLGPAVRSQYIILVQSICDKLYGYHKQIATEIIFIAFDRFIIGA